MSELKNRDFYDVIRPMQSMTDIRSGSQPHGLPNHHLLSATALRAMSNSDLISHVLCLQQSFQQMAHDKDELYSRFRQIKDSYNYFFSAARLAHRLRASDVDTVARLAVEDLPAYFSCQNAAMFLYNPESRLLELCRASSAVPYPAPLHRDHDGDHVLVKLFFDHDVPFVAERVAKGKIFLTNTGEILNSPGTETWRPILGDQALVFPLHAQEVQTQERHVMGGLIIGLASRQLVERDAEVATLFADLLSASLSNARLVQKLNELTIVDSLTQLYNRRHLMNQLTSCIAQSRRHGHHLSLAMLDIDHFKLVNDTHGHVMGDKVLAEMARLIRDSVRMDIDTPARYGGEEFIIIMPFIEMEGAVTAAERLRNSIAQTRFSFDNLTLSLSCSFGVAQYMVGESLENFINRADTALYRAKKRGRNCVVTASTHGDIGKAYD